MTRVFITGANGFIGHALATRLAGTHSIEKARGMLGYEPKVDLTEGMARVRLWLADRGLL